MMARVKPRFKITELREAVLALLDDKSAPDFRSAFARVMHARGIFHRKDEQETYNFYFRKLKPLILTALNTRKRKAQKLV
jgi:hypothetical protein